MRYGTDNIPALFWRRIRIVAGVALVAAAMTIADLGSLFAHGGEDHGEAAAAAPPVSAGAGVSITKEQQFALGMLTEPASRQALAQHVELTGTVIPRTDAVAEVVPPIAGRVVGANLPQLGQRVTRGQVLFRVAQVLAPSERAAIRSEQIAAKAELASAEREVSRLERLEGVVAGKQMTEARIRRDAAREQYNAYSQQLSGSESSVAVTAPISGEITYAEIAAGEVLDGSRIVYRISDLSKVWVQANLFEKDLPRVRDAGRAEVRTASAPGEVIDGSLYRISGAVDEGTRTIPALFLVDNSSGTLRLNMSVTVSAVTSARSGVPAVPREAVVTSGARQVVFVHTQPELFEVRDVTLGSAAGGAYVEVTSGVAQGERILTTGTYQLKNVAGL